MADGSLIIVGTGIKGIAQCTLEAKGWIETADIVLTLVGDSITEAWIEDIAQRTQSLQECYRQGKSRADVYALMTDRILTEVRKGQTVCAAFYGHPGMFVRPAHTSIMKARQEGFDARMLPGISALDSLFADLGFDPAEAGLQTYSAVDFFLRAPNIEPSCGLVLWQIGVFGEQSHTTPAHSNAPLQQLVTALSDSFAPDHEVILYQAAIYAIGAPSIRACALKDLPHMKLTQESTLYIPPAGSKTHNRERAELYQNMLNASAQKKRVI